MTGAWGHRTVRTRIFLIAAIASVGLAAQDRPDPREIPVPPIATRLGTLPGVNDLPALPAMPDVLVMNDGTRVTTTRQWHARRLEMRRLLSYYAVG